MLEETNKPEVEKNIMATIDEFLKEVRLINWFEHGKRATDEYHVIHSIFVAYDDWNEQMLKIWEPHICSLENIAVKKIGDEQIDKIFSIVSLEIGEMIWKKWIFHMCMDRKLS